MSRENSEKKGSARKKKTRNFDKDKRDEKGKEIQERECARQKKGKKYIKKYRKRKKQVES